MKSRVRIARRSALPFAVSSSRMSGVATRATATLVAVGLLAIVRVAAAADKIDKFVDQLESSDDFRVRTQAALALGASKNKKAIDPLCKGLEDSSTAVR